MHMVARDPAHPLFPPPNPSTRHRKRLRRPAQATRWVMTKEEHASKIITTVADYMLAQRVKAAEIESRETYLEVPPSTRCP